MAKLIYRPSVIELVKSAPKPTGRVGEALLKAAISHG